jgi:RNA polymerase sigma-54 factor
MQKQHREGIMPQLRSVIQPKLGIGTNISATQQAALVVLHASTQQLESLIKTKLEDNPFLLLEEEENEVEIIEEAADSDDWSYSFEPVLPGNLNLIENLERNYDLTLGAYLENLWLKVSYHMHPDTKFIGLYIINNLDENGFFTQNIDEVALDLEVDSNLIKEVLQSVQRLDPRGFAAKDFTECLTIQARELSTPHTKNLISVIQNHMGDVARGNLKKIADALGLDEGTVAEVVKLLCTLDPKPVRTFKGDFLEGISPEYFVKTDEKAKTLRIVSNENRYSAQVKLDSTLNSFQSRKKEHLPPGLTEKLNEAKQLIKALEHRSSTVERLLSYLCEKQAEFFFKGPQKLVPLLMREAAEVLDCHESTISRACHKKFISTKWGIFELNYFFSHTVNTYKSTTSSRGESSVEVLKEKIRELIQKENKKFPLTDKNISEIMCAEGLNVARRTVSKYREKLGFLPCKLRKQTW